MKLCVLQGTFNPIHNAHLRVAEYVYNKFNPDKFLFIPACVPPHKECDSSLSVHRLEMVRLALQDRHEFEVSDIEYKRSGKSYTYHTILELYALYKNLEKVYFIIGTDAFRKIDTWYEIDKLKSLVKFIVFPRENNFNPADLDYLKAKGYDFEIQELPYEDISSTEVRDGIKNKVGSIESEIPAKVMEYIEKNGLYIN